MTNDNLHSNFSNDISNFVAEMRAIGYKYDKCFSILRRFDKFAFERNAMGPVLEKDLVLSWTKQTKYESFSTHNARISAIRGLAKYMVKIGKIAYIYPKCSNSINRYSYTPYIFTEIEIASILNASDGYKISTLSQYRHLIIPTILRILYCCGLRVSEALKLQKDDVDLERGLIHIKDAKFNKERIIPMSDGLLTFCRKYVIEIKLNDHNWKYFFPSPYGGHYVSSTIYQQFRLLLQKANISHTGKGPRLHDLRHTFAVHCLKKWVINGKDLTVALPYLSAYLGHNDMRGTQRYLRLTADMYPNIIEKIEKSCSWIVPEVSFYERD